MPQPSSPPPSTTQPQPDNYPSPYSGLQFSTDSGYSDFNRQTVGQRRDVPNAQVRAQGGGVATVGPASTDTTERTTMGDNRGSIFPTGPGTTDMSTKTYLVTKVSPNNKTQQGAPILTNTSSAVMGGTFVKNPVIVTSVAWDGQPIHTGS